MIIDFEGDNTLPLPQRLIKRPPIVDVAAMTHSFRYASMTAVQRATKGIGAGPRNGEKQRKWRQFWSRTVETAYVDNYWLTLFPSHLVPEEKTDFDAMLSVYLIAKAMYQVGYELEHRASYRPTALLKLRTLCDGLELVENRP